MAPRLKRSLSRAMVNQADLSVAVLADPIEAARRRGTTNALFLVDIDNFHVINNGFGRELGDLVLGTVAKRLQQSVANLGYCLACGGDRFMVLVSQTTAEPLFDDVADRLIDAVRTPIRVERGDAPPLVVSASVGSVLDDGAPVEELVRRADIALNQAKVKGFSGHVTFEPAMQEAAESAANLERDLREALDSELLFLNYLPGVDIPTGRLTSAQALLCWQHPERGVIAAGDFVPYLEHSRTIIDVGSWVLQEACMQAAAWQRRGMSIALHVSLSARQLGADVLLGDLRDSLSLSRLNPALLVLEITEDVVMKDTGAMAERLREFKALGVHIAIDNFAADYGTLSQLTRLPLDIVEFDRSLIADIGKEDSAAALIHTLVQIADNLGLETVAAGVEDEAQLEELRSAGCAQAVGQPYSQPVSADELDKLFRDLETQATTPWTSLGGESLVDKRTEPYRDQAVNPHDP